MFNLCLCNAATIRYSQLKFGHMHLCGTDYKYFSPHCCKCNSFGCTVAIRCGNACHGPHRDSLYSGSEQSQFNSRRLVKREAGFPNQTYYDPLMTHCTTKNWLSSYPELSLNIRFKITPHLPRARELMMSDFLTTDWLTCMGFMSWAPSLWTWGRKHTFLHAKPWIPGGEKSIFTVVIH